MSSDYKEKKGFQKIDWTCQQAATDGLDYAWVDTCCIDQSSSAELSEAINSMFRWYKRAAVCYVYLSDILISPTWRVELALCRWFTRGWTLQELLAPREIQLYDKDWASLCKKSQCIQELSDITGIDESILEQRVPLSDVPVCQRMSWASSRQTTRIEDEAYCLMGIFDINMPLLYGEEGRAFMRLQEEVIHATDDLTILAWTYPLYPGLEHPTQSLATSFSGFLADSPRYFGHSGDLAASRRHQRVKHFSISKKKIKLSTAILVQCSPRDWPTDEECTYRSEQLFLPICSGPNDRYQCVLHIRRIGEDGSFVRQNPYHLQPIWKWTDYSTLEPPVEPHSLLSSLPAWDDNGWQTIPWAISKQPLSIRRVHLCQIQLHPSHCRNFKTLAWPASRWDGEVQAFFSNSPNFLAVGAPAHLRFMSPHLNFDLFVLGWDAQDQDKLRFTLVETGQYMDRHRQEEFFRTLRSSSERDTSHLLRELTMAGIPRKSTVVQRLAGSELFTSYSATTEIVEDASLCRYPFWRIKLHVSYHEEIPQEEQETWTYDDLADIRQLGWDVPECLK